MLKFEAEVGSVLKDSVSNQCSELAIPPKSKSADQEWENHYGKITEFILEQFCPWISYQNWNHYINIYMNVQSYIKVVAVSVVMLLKLFPWMQKGGGTFPRAHGCSGTPSPLACCPWWHVLLSLCYVWIKSSDVYWQDLRNPQRKSINYLTCSSSGVHSIIIYVRSKNKIKPFYSCSTRESLASNTSSIVESNRRQNPALSPAHGGAGPAFNFRASTDPPSNEAEKLQKPSNCLQASVTSVW